MLRRLRFVAQAGLAIILMAAALPLHAACTGPAALTAKIKAHPTSDAYAELGNWYGSRNQFACAATALKSAVRLNPKSAMLNYLLGLAYYESHDFNDALPPLRHSLAADPRAIKPHLLLASVFTQINQPQDAASEWAASLKIDSTNSMALHGLSHALITMGDYPSDIGLLKNVKLDDDLSLDLAIAYSKTGMPDDSVATLKAALAKSPTPSRSPTRWLPSISKLSRPISPNRSRKSATRRTPTTAARRFLTSARSLSTETGRPPRPSATSCSPKIRTPLTPSTWWV